MTHHMPRRKFLGAMSTLAAASAFPGGTLFARERLYPPMDLSHFDTPITPAPSEIHFGYAAINLGGNESPGPSKTSPPSVFAAYSCALTASRSLAVPPRCAICLASTS